MVQFVDDAGTAPGSAASTQLPQNNQPQPQTNPQEHSLHCIMDRMQMLHDQQLQTFMHLHHQSTQLIGHVINQQQQLIQQSVCVLQNQEANIQQLRHMIRQLLWMMTGTWS
ncbi:unnamed protein product [Symbiodinium natans]|uniref:Uncharacterized protein n=1 Tax=Symbiodinium natans TaxID=878477 RepID=A0A812TJL2_9DINO|nr:unnamed protein product [Symbiodinium natans]